MLNINFSPFPILKSPKIYLRQITDADADKFFELRSNPQTMRFIPRPLATTKKDAIDLLTLMNDKIISNTAINWAITLPDNDDLIGIIGLLLGCIIGFLFANNLNQKRDWIALAVSLYCVYPTVHK